MIDPATLPAFPQGERKTLQFTSHRIEDHVVIGPADEDALEKHGR